MSQVNTLVAWDGYLDRGCSFQGSHQRKTNTTWDLLGLLLVIGMFENQLKQGGKQISCYVSRAAKFPSCVTKLNEDQISWKWRKHLQMMKKTNVVRQRDKSWEGELRLKEEMSFCRFVLHLRSSNPGDRYSLSCGAQRCISIPYWLITLS